MKRLWIGIVLIMAAWACHRLMAAADPPRELPSLRVALTAPFHMAQVAALHPGLLHRIAVEEGQKVLRGDVLVELDAEKQRIQTERSRLQAWSLADLELKRIRYEQAQRDLDRLQNLSNDSLSAVKELQDARTSAESWLLELDLALLRRETAIKEYALQQALLNDHTLRAPFAGFVGRRLVDVGASVDELEPILELVQLDPLLVTVDLPLATAIELKTGAKTWVWPVEISDDPRIGSIQSVSKVADGASQRMRVRIVVPNSDGRWPAGMKVHVSTGMRNEQGGVNGAAP